MISVSYAPAIPSLRLSGHAGFAEKGKDIVCAAASILAYTLICGGARYRELPEGGMHITGEAAALALIAGGYRLLSENYPQNLRFEVNE